MRRTYTALAAAILTVAVVAGATGCTRVKLADNPATATHTLNKTVTLDGATTLKTDVAMGIGELTLSGAEASGTAMIGTFVYAHPPAGCPRSATVSRPAPGRSPCASRRTRTRRSSTT